MKMATSVLHISEKDLPKNYKNKIIENNEKCAIIRCNLQNIHDINSWVNEFGELTHTKWNSRTTRPEGMRFICRKHFVCHRSSFNKSRESKNADCEANIKVKIKLNNSNTVYTDPYVKVGLFAIISVQKLHSHALITKEAVRLLPPSDAVKAKFFTYFDNGMGIAESCKYHSKMLELLGKSELDLSNNRINPSQRTARHWYNSWKRLNLETTNEVDLLQKLKEKQAAYADSGVKILFNENPFALTLITPLMQRTHELKQSQNVAFIDSISVLEAENICVTFVLASCPAGVSPLGIIITKEQSCEAYQTGFKLLNTAVKNSFGGQGFPNMFITDNSREMVDAIKSVWPNSKNFFSTFCVCQTVWKWLYDIENNIPTEEISSLMLAFQRILFSNNKEEAANAFENLYHSAIPYPNFQSYIADYWEYKELWCLIWQEKTFQEHLLNNFAELCIHIFRDAILSRVIIHKVIALVDFCCTVLDTFYCSKFQKFINNRTSSIKNYLNSLLKPITCLDAKEIVCNGEKFYVPNEDKSEVYIVIAKTALCSCVAGQNGKFCEHQCAVYKYFDALTGNVSAITEEDRYNVGILAMGEEVPLKYFSYPHMLGHNDEKISLPENYNDFENNTDEPMTSAESTEELYIYVYEDEDIDEL